jgi:stage V sporulation protein K
LCKEDDQFGKEAIEELMQHLGGDPIVILAGYPAQMAEFMDANAGLKRRFPMIFNFPDYSSQDLSRIFLKAASEENKLDEEITLEAVTNLIDHEITKEQRSELNGTVAKRLLQHAMENRDRRLHVKSFTREQAEYLAWQDLSSAIENVIA